MAKTQTQNVLPEQSWLYRLIRIYPQEFGRTFIVWIIRFLYRFVFVVSWTLIVSHVAAAYSSELTLPTLFLFHAFLVLLGSVLSFLLFQKLQLEHVFLYSLILGVSILLLCQFFVHTEETKIAILLFVESFILVQLSINIETFTERFFTPYESARTFPVAESGDTIATLLAGMFLYFNASQMSMTRMLWVVIAVLSLLIPFFLQYHSFLRSHPGMCLFRKQIIGGEHEEFRTSSVAKIITKHPYIVTLIIVVLAQWFFSVVLEFLFTYAVSAQYISHAELVPATAGGLENVLVQEFGGLQILFASATLVSNLFLAGRFITSLGVIGSILLHPLVALLSLAGMITNFGTTTAIVARMNAEVTGVIYRNSYQSSYYVFDEMESQFTRIFLDGIIRPLGSVFGTCFLVLSYFFVPPSYYLTFILTGLFIVLVIFALSTLTLQKQYNRLIVHQLENPELPLDLKIGLLDVLSQVEYAQKPILFEKLYTRKDEPLLVRIKLIEIFSRELTHLQDILEGLHHEDSTVRFASISALKHFVETTYFDENLLSRQTVIQELMRRYVDEPDKNIGLMIVLLLARFKEKYVLDFLLDRLQNDTGEALSHVIMACNVFGDPSFHPLIADFLDSKDPRVWAQACVVLFAFESYQAKVHHLLRSKLQDPERASRVAVAFVLTQYFDPFYAPYLHERLVKSEDILEKVFVAFALLGLGEENALKDFSDLLFDLDLEANARFLSLVPSFIDLLPTSKRYVVERYFQAKALSDLHIVLKKVGHRELQDLDVTMLKELSRLYRILNATEEMIKIDHVISTMDPRFRHDSYFFGKIPLTFSSYLS